MPEMRLDKMDLGIHDFFTYPPVGEDDYRYMFQTAQVRSMETQMLTRTTLTDMANASDFASAASSLSGTEYTLPQGAGGIEVETVLRQRRAAVRKLFDDLMLDERIVEVFRSRDDYANLRLALRRILTDKPVGTDYSPEGNVPPELLAAGPRRTKLRDSARVFADGHRPRDAGVLSEQGYPPDRQCDRSRPGGV